MGQLRGQRNEVHHLLTRVHLFLDLLLAFAEKKELETEYKVSLRSAKRSAKRNALSWTLKCFGLYPAMVRDAQLCG
jgi:hypothetical protein